MPWWGYLIIGIIVVLLGILVALFVVGRKLQRRQAEQEKQMKAMAQTVSMLVIDKKKMKLKDSGLPEMVLEQSPKYLRRVKMPIVKAKIGPRVMSLIADGKVFESLPVKKEVKVVISGIYITELKSVRGGSVIAAPKKKTFLDRFRKGKDSGKKTTQKSSSNSKKK